MIEGILLFLVGLVFLVVSRRRRARDPGKFPVYSLAEIRSVLVLCGGLIVFLWFYSHSDTRHNRRIPAPLLPGGTTTFVPTPPGAFLRDPSSSLVLLVQHASKGNAHLVRTFSGPQGLTGLVMAPGHVIGWSNGREVFLGPVFDRGGLNITEAARRALYPATNATFVRAIDRSDGFVIGARGPLVTLVADPNCTFCHRTWLALQPLLRAGRLRVRLVPVAIVDPDTAIVRGAEILSSRVPATLWNRNEQQFHAGTEQGGLSLDLPITNAGRVALAGNTETFLQAFPGGHPATPTFILGQQVHTGAMTANALQAWLSAPMETP